ncbi:MAG: hypothetical protein ACM3JG_20355 [Thiohalocapsa sp.]
MIAKFTFEDITVGAPCAAEPAVAASALPRYVVHVGLPKTGTKYLQYNFWRLREELRAQGVLYPAEWLRGGAMWAHHDLTEALTLGPDQRLAETFIRLNASGSATILLSSEGFNGLPDVALQYLRQLTQEANVEIVFYARRWSDWIPSQWQQAVKQGSLQTFPEWYAALLAAGDDHPGINQASSLDKFAWAFGRRNIRLVSYSNLRDHNVDIFDHFCSAILGLPASAAIKSSGGVVHESMGVFLTELIRCLNRQEAMRSETSGYQVFEAYQEVSKSDVLVDDVSTLYGAMERHILEMPLDDDLQSFADAYERLNDYRGQLVSPQFGGNVFEKRRTQCRSVRPDFLMEGEALAAMRRIWDAVRQRLSATSPTQATPP